MCKGVTNSQQCDIYQLSLVIFELLFSPVRNKLTVSDKEYNVILQRFKDGDKNTANSQRIPLNFFNGSLPEELDTVSFY